jgi:hypothetical protein
MKQIEKTVEYMSKIGEMNNQGQFDKAIDSYVRFVDKVNNVKLENLQTATNMFAKMAEFSASINGNFEGLAETINEKLLPLLEKLNGGIGKAGDSIEAAASNTRTITTNTGEQKTVTKSDTENKTVVKDYTNIIDQIHRELKKIQSTLTDGTAQFTTR